MAAPSTSGRFCPATSPAAPLPQVTPVPCARRAFAPFQPARGCTPRAALAPRGVQAAQVTRRLATQPLRAWRQEQPATPPLPPPGQQQPQAQPDGSGATDALAWLAATALLCSPAAAGAAETVAYNPAGGSETLKTLAGVAYIGLVVFYFFRLFKKRAKAATSQPLASTMSRDSEEDSDDEDEVAAAAAAAAAKPEVKATPLNSFIGAAQAGVICYLLFLVSSTVDAYFADKPLPEQYTAHQIAVLVQTVVRGLAYLITFIFGANCLGLTGLGIQLLLFPNSLDDSGAPRRRPSPEEKLPDVNVTDDIFAIRRAFAEAERQGARSAGSSLSSADEAGKQP